MNSRIYLSRKYICTDIWRYREGLVHSTSIKTVESHDFAIIYLRTAHNDLSEAGRNNRIRRKLVRRRHFILEIIFRLPAEIILAETCSSVVRQEIIRRRFIRLFRKPLDPARAIVFRHSVVLQHIPVRLPCHQRNDVQTRSPLIRAKHHPSL